jgi:protoheme IX farnesyltransferase
MNTTSIASPLRQPLKIRLQSFFLMCKPRVNSLIVFTAIIGMLLAIPEGPPLGLLLAASLGIALVSGAAAAFNCVIEQHIDARMARTWGRPLPRGQADARETLFLATLVGGIGLAILHHFANPLTTWLTLATFLGYAVIYTVVLKPATPMNIVIGGASGAMPPLLGWTAMTGSIGVEPLALFLIIFLWTPPHFWALACYRREEYAKAGLPMLPVTHGVAFTCQHILLYTVMLAAASLIPVSLGMSGAIYLVAIALLDLGFLGYAIAMCYNYSDKLAKQTFRYSILYLTLMFAALFLDRLY